jgi:hypothetical protein
VGVPSVLAVVVPSVGFLVGGQIFESIYKHYEKTKSEPLQVAQKKLQENEKLCQQKEAVKAEIALRVLQQARKFENDLILKNSSSPRLEKLRVMREGLEKKYTVKKRQNKMSLPLEIRRRLAALSL